ncbi:TRAP transporter fused permease subunit [Desulfofundulus thermobenzoicus]|uniref:TRAP transporter fused permease subunit n=1 Tax=Desulfofundulus thermobenzoicus TaxID=29376 RepID=A0A6N7ISU7_9FIRM|nr:TRAP transporter permease [Desulfofundulus thermobenzoicus]MQL53132.1 TRAP transporter fused permease subunit [Desulfofundulus thermobenzoicus]
MSTDGGLTSRHIGKTVVTTIAVALSLFQLYTAGFGVLTPVLQRATHITFVFVLVLLLFNTTKKARFWWLDAMLLIGAVATGIYMWLTYQTLVFRAGDPTNLDMIMGIATIVLILEVTRRTTGWPLVIIAVLALVYARFGPYFPGILSHKAYSLERIISQLYLSMEGIWGVTLGVAATMVALFVLFGAFLEATGGGKIFIELAFSIAGKSTGGPAKVAVVSSGLMGTISGSPVANVATVGTFTIPLMKRLGYDPHVAGGIEAVASSGGAIMPPVMGAGAFVMSEMTGIPYSRICIAAAIPAVLYYLSLFLAVHFEAKRKGMKGLPAAELPNLRATLQKSLFLLIPIFVLLYLLVIVQVSPMKAAFWSILVLLLTSITIGPERFNFRANLAFILSALEKGARDVLTVSAACAAAGIIIGVIAQTGIGLTFSSIVVEAAGGRLILALALTMVASIILGMGLPPTAAYIVLAAMGAPALVQMNVPVLIAHLFIFYFSVFAPITPPVALAAYTAAGIAESDPMRTGVTAFRLGLVAFLIPYMFTYGPSLVAVGAAGEIILTVIMACIGVFCLAAAVIGWMMESLSWFERLIFFGAALSLIDPGLLTDLLGLALLGIAMLSILLRRRRMLQIAERKEVAK